MRVGVACPHVCLRVSVCARAERQRGTESVRRTTANHPPGIRVFSPDPFARQRRRLRPRRPSLLLRHTTDPIRDDDGPGTAAPAAARGHAAGSARGGAIAPRS